MSRVYYNKLIRDGIPQKIQDNGGEYEVRKLEDDSEFEQELLKKIQEEGSALAKVRSREEFLAEYADLTAVLDELTRLLEFSEADIKLAIEENVKKKGGFKERLFLHWSSDTDYKSNETPQGLTKT
jgi:predicted house-cleaning noncanonical NTP pyrophosphatase (MazG superfamily)